MQHIRMWLRNWMRELRQRSQRAQDGFTFVELMIVVAIIGILAAIAVPQFSKATERAENAQIAANTKVLSQAAQMYYLDTHKDGEVPISELKSNGYLDIDEKKTKDFSKYHVRISEDGKVTVSVDKTASGKPEN